MLRIAASCLVVGAILASGLPAQAQFQNLTSRIPNDANVILLMDVDKMHESPLAEKEGWREKHEQMFSSGLLLVPPQAAKFVLTSQLDIEFMQPKWEVALMDLKYEPSLPKLAAELGGEVDKISDRDAVALPGDIYAVKFGPRFAAIARPADRQVVGRWINKVYSNQAGKLSPYMTEAVKFAEQGAPIIMAIDLEHALSADKIRERLDGMESLKGKDLDLDKLSEVLASIRGVSLGITLGEKRFGKLKIDFADDVSMVGSAAKPLLLEVLANKGAMIDEFADWKIGGTPKQITLEGTLYQSGMRRILSLLDTPPSLQQPKYTPEDSDPNAEKNLVAQSSKAYFQSVTSLLDDLNGKRKGDQVVTFGQVGLWFEKYARKIDTLPILNVDPELVDFGAYIATSLRDAESAMKGIGSQSRLRSNEVPYYYNTNVRSNVVGVTRWNTGRNYSWNATPDRSRRGAEVSKVRTQERIRGNTSANLTMQGVQQATADMRRIMTQKYQIEF